MLFKGIDLIDENYEVQKDINIITEDEKIIYIGKEVPKDYSGQVFEGKNKVAVPGFFNTHCHVPMTILRGYGDGLPLHRWLHEKMFPFEAKLTPEDCYWATSLGAIEMIKSGVVSFSEMYFDIEDIIRGIQDSGLKANVCHGISSFNEGEDYKAIKGYRDTERLWEKFNIDSGNSIRIDVGLHAEYTSNQGLVRELAALANDKNMRLHTHMSETQKEHEDCKKRFGMTPVAYFEKNGLLDQPLTAAHCVWIEGEDFDILKDRGASVAHCISSNLKLGSGFAPVKKMMDMGINVSIGTDGASSNNNLNMLEELNLAAMANKGVTRDPEFMSTKQIMKLSTYNGAISQGREDCGRIMVGNRADIIVFDMDKPHLQPVHDVLSNIVFAAQSEDICLSMIDGKVVYKDGQLITLDQEKIIFEVNSRSKRILKEL